MKSRRRIFWGIFGLGGFIVGATVAFGAWQCWRTWQASSWPTTPGKVNKLSLAEHSGSEGGSTYQVQVEYSYKVFGVAYQGSTLAYGYSSSSGQEVHQEVLEKLQNAKTVMVRYNPSDPAISCLSYGFHRSLQLLFAFAFVFLSVIAVGGMLFRLCFSPDEVLLRNLDVQ